MTDRQAPTRDDTPAFQLLPLMPERTIALDRMSAILTQWLKDGKKLTPDELGMILHQILAGFKTFGQAA